MILNRILAAAGHENDVPDAGSHGFFDAILNDGLVDERQHFLGLCFGCGQEASAEARRRKDCLSNSRVHVAIPQ
jgi:hypothetical protein